MSDLWTTLAGSAVMVALIQGAAQISYGELAGRAEAVAEAEAALARGEPLDERGQRIPRREPRLASGGPSDG